jgi:Domain of unknown function (DUF4839)
MAVDAPRYEYESVRVLRGTEGRTIAKWVQNGWELDAQSQGSMLRTDLTFRRVQAKASWRVLAMAGAVVVLVLVIAIGVVTERRGGSGSTDAAAVTSTQTEQPAAATTSAAAPTQPTGEKTLTAENSPELAALLSLKDPGAASVGEFAAAYRGRTIEFDGNIGAMNHHGDYTTRYDILVGAGDFSETSSSGPNFQFDDVNIVSDLHLTGSNIPAAIGVGDNLHVVARVGDYNSTSELFRLEPVSTQVR